MISERIRRELLRLQDEGYKAFQGALIPTVKPEDMIGVRTPALRALAKELAKDKDGEEFFAELPHRYFEEDQLHAFLICEIKDFPRCISEIERFLPYLNNWASCDQMSPPVLRKHREELLPYIEKWLASSHPYSLRFAIKLLMDHFLGETFDPRYPAWVAAIRSEDYYVNMMIAWFFATALAKRYDEALPYFERRELPVPVHNKAIQKAIESARISQDRKEYLRKIKIPARR